MYVRKRNNKDVKSRITNFNGSKYERGNKMKSLMLYHTSYLTFHTHTYDQINNSL